MKRSAALAPLSRDHHVALAAALRLRRAGPGDLEEAAAHFAGFFEPRGRHHFAIEEELILPALPPEEAGWGEACERVLSEHERIRALAARLAGGEGDRLALARETGELLNAHVRFEERELFGLLEERLPEDALARLGEAVEAAERAGP